MSSPSEPTENAGSVVQLIVQCNGVPLDDSIQVSGVSITHNLNRVSEAVIHLRSASFGPVFETGSMMMIFAAWDNDPTQMIYFGNIQSFAAAANINTGIDFTLTCRQSLSEVKVITLDLTQPPVLTLTYGDTMISFTGTVSGMKSIAKTCTVSCIGTAAPFPGSMIKLDNVGNDFSGTVPVTQLSHIIQDGNWISTLVTGNAVSYPSTSVLQNGLRSAIVKKLSGDPEQKGRILVSLVSEENESQDVWAYYTVAYAAGTCLFPEIGDEVIVDTLDNDADTYVVLGSIVNKENYPATYVPDEHNYIKSFTTKGGIIVLMNDNEKVLSILTPMGNEVLLSDEDKSILLKDENNNSITLSQDGIILSSDKDIILKAKGSLVLDAVGKASLVSKRDITLDGANITQTAEITFSAKGNASAELSASGQTTVKGAMVLIN